jgi:3-dehydroquinate synthase
MEITVKTKPECKIIIQRGIIKNNKLPDGFIITDANVYDNYKEIFDNRKFFCIDAGEKSKNLETYFKILKAIPENMGTIIALGGGVVGDISGLVASTYKRGIKLIIIPTTLLGMVDSSIGGKNGVDLGEKKNYIGTICQPSLVMIDPELLKTLPEKEFKNGLAEVIKYSHLFESPSLNLVGSKNFSDENIEKIIIECCKNKVKVVEKDIFDKSYRHILNFGHTIGHAIEILYCLSHGEAISIGMIKELEIAEKMGLADKNEIEKIKKSFVSAGLPIKLPQNIDVEKVLEIMKSDKKGKFNFAFSEKNYDIEVNEKVIRECLEERE